MLTALVIPIEGRRRKTSGLPPASPPVEITRVPCPCFIKFVVVAPVTLRPSPVQSDVSAFMFVQLPSPKRPQLHQPPSQSRHNLTELGQWSAEDTQSGLRSCPCILRASSCQSWHYHLFPRAGQLLATRLALHICCAFNVHDGNPRAHFDCQQGSALLKERFDVLSLVRCIKSESRIWIACCCEFTPA